MATAFHSTTATTGMAWFSPTIGGLKGNAAQHWRALGGIVASSKRVHTARVDHFFAGSSYCPLVERLKDAGLPISNVDDLPALPTTATPSPLIKRECPTESTVERNVRARTRSVALTSSLSRSTNRSTGPYCRNQSKVESPIVVDEDKPTIESSFVIGESKPARERFPTPEDEKCVRMHFAAHAHRPDWRGFALARGAV